MDSSALADEVVTMAATPIDAGTNTVIATGEKAVDGIVLAVAAAGMASKVAISTLMDREAWLLSQRMMRCRESLSCY
jgi:hypothetical protein